MGLLMTGIDDLIAFKGDRPYIQGPDILNRLLAFAAAGVASASVTDIRFAAHGFIQSNHITMKSFSSLEEIGEGEWPSTLTARIDGEPRIVAIKARAPQSAAPLRQPFDEGNLQASMLLDGQSILFSAPLPYSLIEVAVSMKKKLMQTIFPDEKVKWVFVRADLKTLPAAVSENVTVTCRTSAPGRIYRSDLAVDGSEIGTLYFIGIKQ